MESENWSVHAKQFQGNTNLGFRIINAIGEGSFALVHKGVLVLDDGTEIDSAIKIHTQVNEKYAFRELEHFLDLDEISPHIVQMYMAK